MVINARILVHKAELSRTHGATCPAYQYCRQGTAHINISTLRFKLSCRRECITADFMARAESRGNFLIIEPCSEKSLWQQRQLFAHRTYMKAHAIWTYESWDCKQSQTRKTLCISTDCNEGIWVTANLSSEIDLSRHGLRTLRPICPSPLVACRSPGLRRNDLTEM